MTYRVKSEAILGFSWLGYMGILHYFTMKQLNFIRVEKNLLIKILPQSKGNSTVVRNKDM